MQLTFEVVNGVAVGTVRNADGSPWQGPVAIHGADVPGNVVRVGFAATGEGVTNRTAGVAVCRATANRPERVVLLDNHGKPALVITDGEGGVPSVQEYGALTDGERAEIDAALDGSQE